MEISNDVYNSVSKYFSLLSHTGYKSYDEVEKLLVFMFIEELLTGTVSYLITEGDYNVIDKALNCISGSCMIGYPDYKKAIAGTVRNVYKEYRITETEILRNSEDGFLRVMS